MGGLDRSPPCCLSRLSRGVQEYGGSCRRCIRLRTRRSRSMIREWKSSLCVTRVLVASWAQGHGFVVCPSVGQGANRCNVRLSPPRVFGVVVLDRRRIQLASLRPSISYLPHRRDAPEQPVSVALRLRPCRGAHPESRRRCLVSMRVCASIRSAPALPGCPSGWGRVVGGEGAWPRARRSAR